MARYNELRNAYGAHFEDLFSKLMKDKYGMRYKATSTYGNLGDLKVDGILDFAVAFAVYAPEIYKDSNVMEKLKSDFEGFMAHKNNGEWQDIQEYIFVIKRERDGITSSVLNLISSFRKVFPVDIMAMDDINIICNSYLPFSEDGRLLQEFKEDVTEIMEYVIETDFSAEPFSIDLSDKIKLEILNKWNKKRYIFLNDNIENLKQDILIVLNELCRYLTPSYMQITTNGQLLYKNDSFEAGEKLRNELQPGIYKIRCTSHNLLEQLYSII